MADILIRGMEMPVEQPVTLILDPSGRVWLPDIETSKEYTASELPPHGDLISKQTALAALYSDYAYAAMDVIENEVPVIIPSNKEAK